LIMRGVVQYKAREHVQWNSWQVKASEERNSTCDTNFSVLSSAYWNFRFNQAAACMFPRADFSSGPKLSVFCKRIYREFLRFLQRGQAIRNAAVCTVHRPGDGYPVGMR
jgi:hypothetical protein